MEPDEQSLADTLRAGFEQIEETPAEPIVQAVEETVEQKAELARDESGKFVKKSEPEASAAALPSTAPVPAAPPVVDTYDGPSSWSKQYRQAWAGLTPELKDYIKKREGDYASGVSTYKEEAEKAKSLNEAMAPFMPDLQKHGIQPTQWISNLGNAHRMLALGSPEQKMQMFGKLAHDYGVDLRAMATGQQPDQQTQWMRQQLEELRGTVTSWQTQQEQAQQAKINQEIEKFKADASHQHYEAVRETMAGLLQSGLASDLETAYQKAIRMNDETFTQLVATQQQGEAQKLKEVAEKAKAKAVSVKSATPRSMTNGKGDDLRSALLSAASEHGL